MTGGPVFVLTIHRSGGTALARALNRHPDLMIWGEHGGFINKFAELDALVSRYPRLVQPLAERGLAEDVRLGKFQPEGFDPWTNPFEQADWRDWCRRFLEATFRRDLHPGQRWGFKEVRYHSVATARFLTTMFPDGRFVLLRRDLSQLIVSNMLAPWSIGRLDQTGATASEAEAVAAVFDCAYALAVVDRGLSEIAAAMPGLCRMVTHEQLRAPAALYPSLFAFLDLPQWPAMMDEVCEAAARPLGVTNPDWQRGHISRPLVLRILPEALAAALADLTARGPDLGRLKRLAATGRYSFLVGDHELVGTNLSSMF